MGIGSNSLEQKLYEQEVEAEQEEEAKKEVKEN